MLSHQMHEDSQVFILEHFCVIGQGLLLVALTLGYFQPAQQKGDETVLRQGGHHLQVLKNKHTGVLGVGYMLQSKVLVTLI